MNEPHITTAGLAPEPDTKRPPGARDRFPGERTYDTVFASLSTLLVSGIYLLGWAAIHGNTVPALLSLWSAVLFTGLVLLAVWLLLPVLRNHRQGVSWKRAVPQGYHHSLLGVVLILAGIGGTQIWQAVAGPLDTLETLVLPTTLMGLLGAILLVSGPFRAAWLRFPAGREPGWAAALPVLLSFTWIFSLGTFLTQFAHPWVQADLVTNATPTAVFSDLYVMRADGTVQTRLTFHPEHLSFGPTFSPDGRTIAFALDAGAGTSSLYVMNADGTNPVQFTHGALTCYLQHWSPDGRQLVFIGQTGNDVTTAAVYTINADGSNLRRLTHEHAREYGAVWSPDGQHIAFGSLQGGTWHLFVMQADGSNVRRLTSMSGNKPTWSPDGRFLAFTSNVSGQDALYVMNADGSHIRLLTASGDHAAWSPDGRQIAFESNRTGNEEIYVMNPDGTGITNLTRNPTLANQLPAWSPDSHEITYMAQSLPAPGTGEMRQALGIASMLIQVAFFVGCLFLLVWRWQVPFGSLTLIFLLNSFLLAVLANNSVLILAGCATGLVADLLCWQLKPSRDQAGRSALFAGGVAVVWSALSFLTLALTQGIAWSLPVWTGSIFLAGLVGLVLSFGLRPGR